MSVIPAGSIVAVGPADNTLTYFDAPTGAVLGRVPAGGGIQQFDAIDILADLTLAVLRFSGDLANSATWAGLLFPPAGPGLAPIALGQVIPFCGGIEGPGGGNYSVGSFGDQSATFAGSFVTQDATLDQFQSYIQLTSRLGASGAYWRLNPVIPVGVHGDFRVKTFAIGLGASRLYFTGIDRTNTSDGCIHVLDLTTGSNLPDLINESALFPGAYPATLTVLTNGNIVAFWANTGTYDGTYTIRVYSSVGAILATWQSQPYGHEPWGASIAQARGLEASSVWVSYIGLIPAPPSLDQIDVTTGTVLRTLDMTGVFDDGVIPAFCVLPQAVTIADAAGAIIAAAYLNCLTHALSLVAGGVGFGTSGTVTVLDPSGGAVASAVVSWAVNLVVVTIAYTVDGVYTVSITPTGGAASVPFSFSVYCGGSGSVGAGCTVPLITPTS